MDPALDERRLGDYRLKQLLGENELVQTWLAEQVSISRLVIVDELTVSDEATRDAFLADVRAKAAVDHPLISSVYEAVYEPGLCFYARELLPGTSLKKLEKAGGFIAPVQLASLLRRVSEAQLQHESHGHSTAPLGLGDIYLDEHGVVRLKNLVIDGPRSLDQAARDVAWLGSRLVPLVPGGQPGATRMLTLFGWMRGEELEAPITWSQVHDFCGQIEHQLAAPLSSLTPTKNALQLRKKPPVAAILSISAVVFVTLVILAIKMRPIAPPVVARPVLPEPVTIAAGTYATPDGMEQPIAHFTIAAHEVTIGQYAEFVETLGMLAKDDHQKIFDHPEQPPGKSSHQPERWTELFAAANLSGSWDGQPVTLDSPVTGLDWWDAAAYAEWKKARLPTQEEWFAALSMKPDAVATLPPDLWHPLTAQSPDRTPNGLIGMAGSVSEWTARPAPNPANPLGERLWIIIGGSFLKPGSNALSREWVPDRSLRRADLGFRLAYD